VIIYYNFQKGTELMQMLFGLRSQFLPMTCYKRKCVKTIQCFGIGELEKYFHEQNNELWIGMDFSFILLWVKKVNSIIGWPLYGALLRRRGKKFLQHY
jgi:hypothetical protein